MIKALKLLRNRIMNPRVTVTKGTKNTIVTVLGWAGASDRNVEKYSKLYQDKGFTTVQFTAPALNSGFGTAKTRKVTELAKTLDRVLLDPNQRLVIHLFSMNGVFTLCSLNLQYPELRILEKCDGLFFDSCPIHNRDGDWRMVKAYSIVMQHVYDSMKLNTNLLTSSMYQIAKYLAILRFIYSVARDNALVNAGLINVEKVSSYHYLLNNPHLPPVLSFVYSDGDIVCDANLISEFHKKLEGQREVISTRFKDSLHVEHYRKHPVEYLAQIDEFLAKVEKVQTIGSKL